MRQCLFIAGLLVCLAGSAWAHVGDRLFSFFELTDEDLAQIDLHDGSADDWRDVVGEPSLTASQFYIAGGDVPAYDPADLDFQIWRGWHRASSRIYVAMESSDNAYVNQYEGMEGTPGNIMNYWSFNKVHYHCGTFSGGKQALLR